jgi:hypothetical protein
VRESQIAQIQAGERLENTNGKKVEDSEGLHSRTLPYVKQRYYLFFKKAINHKTEASKMEVKVW